MSGFIRPGSGNGHCARGILVATALAMGVMPVGIVSAETLTKVSILNGHQASSETPAFGCGRFVIDTDANTLDYHIAFGGLIGAEAISHIHGPGAPGEGGSVMVFLPFGNPKVGTWNYPEAVEDTLVDGLSYIAVHSSEFPLASGEIRGQIVDLVAVLDPIQADPPGGSAGRGYGLFNIDTCTNELNYYIVVEALDGTETAAHLHGYALHGSDAAPLHTLPAGSIKTGVWNYPQAQEERILKGQVYVNIHSSTAAAGEIRGQVVPISAPVDGTQEVPPSGASGHGCACVAHDPATDTLSYHLAYGGLTGPPTGVHIHGFAAPGFEATVQHVVGTANPVVGTWSYAMGDEAAITDGLTYVNIHTADHAGGQLRGQIVFPVTPCVSDLNCDGGVGAADLALLLGGWGPNPGHPADFNNDGLINAGDLAVLLGGWGLCP